MKNLLKTMFVAVMAMTVSFAFAQNGASTTPAKTAKAEKKAPKEAKAPKAKKAKKAKAAKPAAPATK